MVMKILANELTYAQYPDMSEKKPRQLFVTRSQYLATKVKDMYEGMYYAHVQEGRSVGPSPQALVDADEEVRHGANGCQRFGDLNDDDFPLFVSFDRVSL